MEPPQCCKASQTWFPSVQKVSAEGVYDGEKVANATAILVVRKLGDRVGRQGLPRRWVVEGFFAWIESPPTSRPYHLGHRSPQRRPRHAVDQEAGSLA
jgi:hypothetical protein